MNRPEISREVQALVLITIAIFIVVSEWTWAFLGSIEIYIVLVFVGLYIREFVIRYRVKRRIKHGWIVIGNEVI